MSSQVKRDLELLTETIVNVKDKPHLRGIIGFQLVKMSHPVVEVEAALAEFFDKSTVH